MVGVPLEVNVAVTLVVLFTVTLHRPVPEHAPDQPVKVEPVDAIATRVTAVPFGTTAEHVEPQVIAPPVTVPVPVPNLETVTVEDGTDPGQFSGWDCSGRPVSSCG